jgi:two-component system chemotaxis sensor kinase CheA
MDSFEEELKVGFLEEASQLLVDAEQCFLLLESNPKDTPTLEKLFRIAHNIKGSSKAVGFDGLGAFTHEFESFMLQCKSGQIPIVPGTVSLLLKCNDHIKQYMDLLKENHAANLDSSQLVDEIHNFKAEEPTEIAEESISTDEVALVSDVSQNELVAIDETIPQIGESESVVEPSTALEPEVLETATPTLAPVPVDVPSVAPETKEEKRPVAAAPSQGAGQVASEESIRVSLSRLDKLLNFVGELVIFQTVLKDQAFNENPQVLRKTIHQMGKVTKEVQDLSMSLRMVPLKQTFQKMQRIVRDVSSLLGKKVQLVLQGEETEVDKTVLESLSDPLVHLIRNAVDHGIESPSERVAAGKSETGQVILRAFHEGGKLVIEVKDNGGGIPAERLKQKALEKGILKPGQVISDQDAVNLIFHAGFSTKAEVTEVSGRGVGMDVVKTNIEQMQGEIIVGTVLGQGSTFKIILPLTLAIIDGMVVRSGEDRYIIPLVHVHETVKPETKDLKFATGVGEILLLRGESLPVIRLSQVLGKRKIGKVFPEEIAIIVRTQAKPFAALVDDVIGQYQVVIKKLGSEMQNLRGYSGSAILGDGKPALILELGELVATARGGAPSQQRQAVA